MDINRIYDKLYENQDEATQALMRLTHVYTKYVMAKSEADGLQDFSYVGSIFNPIISNLQFDINTLIQTAKKEEESFFETLEEYQILKHLSAED